MPDKGNQKGFLILQKSQKAGRRESRGLLDSAKNPKCRMKGIKKIVIIVLE
jgi:hypothetical protein